MREVIDIDTNGEVMEYSGDVCKNFKAVYYLMNAKPDTEIKLFKGKKIISLENIITLNNYLEEKLANHEIEVRSLVINVVLKKGTIISFENFEEFKKFDWNRKEEETESILIKKDFFIKLPNYTFPQRHTVKIKMGGSLNAADTFTLLLKDEEEVDIDLSDVVCKIDFINNILAEELFRIVETWYENLEAREYSKIFHCIVKNKNVLGDISKLLMSLSGIFLWFLIIKNIIFPINIVNYDFNRNLIIKIMFSIGMLVALFIIFNFIGFKIDRKIFDIGDKIKSKKFLITNKDLKESKNVKKQTYKEIFKFIFLELSSLILDGIIIKIFDCFK